MLEGGLPLFPIVSSEVVVERRPEGVRLRCLSRGMTPERILDLGPDGGVFADEVLPLLDGSRTVAEVCRALEDRLDADSVIRALDLLADEALVVEGRPHAGPIGGVRAYRALRAAERSWQADLAAEDWPTLEDGRWLGWYRGWWAENLHFAAGAAKKFALTAGRSEAHRELLTAFLIDEHDHATVYFRKAARALAIDPDAVLAAPPLPEMAALSAFILRGCKRQPLYLGWIADQVERAQAFYMQPAQGQPSERGIIRAQLSARLSAYPQFLEAVFDHADVEDAAEHGSYGKVMFERTESISEADWSDLLDLARATETLFVRKERAIFRHYGDGCHEPPRAGTNELARVEPTGAATLLEPPVRELARRTVQGLTGSRGWPRLAEPGPRRAVSAAWATLQREWALAALQTPALAPHYDARFAATCLSVGLCARERALRTVPVTPASLEALSVASVVAEAAESDVGMALGQAALLEEIGSALSSVLGGELPAAALRPIEPKLPDRPATAIEALGALGAVGPVHARAIGAHLQIVGELLAALLEST